MASNRNNENNSNPIEAFLELADKHFHRATFDKDYYTQHDEFRTLLDIFDRELSEELSEELSDQKTQQKAEKNFINQLKLLQHLNQTNPYHFSHVFKKETINQEGDLLGIVGQMRRRYALESEIMHQLGEALELSMNPYAGKLEKSRVLVAAKTTAYQLLETYKREFRISSMLFLSCQHAFSWHPVPY